MADECIGNSKVRRVCLLEQNASLRRAKDEITKHHKIFEGRSRSFTQDILLYLAEKSQMRHQRQVRVDKVTKMFRVPLDQAEPTLPSMGKSVLKKRVTVLDNKRSEQVDNQSVQRSCSIISETSSIEESFRRTRLRSRARSIGVIVEEISKKKPRRRLSAPEVIVTTVKQLDKDDTIMAMTPNRQPTLDKMETLSTISSPLRLSSSTFKTGSRNSPFLLKRVSTHDSSSITRRRPLDQVAIPSEDVPNPILDPRFVQLMSSLHIFKKDESDRKTTKKSTVAP